MARGKRPRTTKTSGFRMGRKKARVSAGTQALRLIKAQLKEREIMYQDEMVTIGTVSGTVQPIGRVSGGNNSGQRTGDKITLKSLYVRATVIKPPRVVAEVSGLTPDVFHLALVLQKVVGDPAEVPSYDDVFSGTPIQGPLYNTQGRGEFTVLAQEKVVIKMDGMTRDQTPGDWDLSFGAQSIDWYPKVKGLPQWYKGPANSTGYKNRLWIFARAQRVGTDGTETGTTQAHCAIRLGYTDTS